MRLKAAIILLLSSTIIAVAQQFTYVDWDILRPDTTPIHYSEVIPLASDYADYTYTVTLDYPEYQPLTTTESTLVDCWGEQLPENPIVHTGVAVSRKQGVLDVAFIPIVRRQSKYYKLTSFKMTITRQPKPTKRTTTTTTRTTSTSTRYTSSSVLATGRWVKIGITTDGVYRLSNTFLNQIGFSDPANVKLYGYGGHVQDEEIDPDSDFDDLEEIPLYRDSDGALFFGKGLISWTKPSTGKHPTHRSNSYATTACYFLTEGTDPQTLTQTTDGVSPTTNITYTPANVLYEKEQYSWLQSGRRFFESTNYSTSNTHTYTLATPDAVSSQGATLKVSFTSHSTSKTNTITTTADNTTLGTMTISTSGDYDEAKEATRTYTLSSLSNTVNVTISSTAGIDARLGYIELSYSRNLTMTDDYLYIQHTQTTPANFVINTSGRQNVQLWRLGTRGTPAYSIKGTTDGTTLTVPVSNPSQEYVAVDVDASYPTPTYISTIDNQNLHATTAQDLIIIVPTSGTLYTQAERLAQAHRTYDNLRVLTVRADQIYNEFSSGTPDATAYRRFMKMLYDRATTDDDMPRYLLLFGDGLWDNRMITEENTSKSPDNYLLCYESENSLSHTNSYVMEDYFGLLDDGEGDDLKENKVDIGVGRFPVTTVADATNLVDKTINYIENKYADSWRNTICVMGDDGDQNDHILKAERIADLIEDEYPTLQVNRIYWDAYTRKTGTTGYTYPGVTTDINTQMDQGCLMMNYTGHANPREFSHELALKLSDFEAYTSNNLPLWVTAACDVAPFDMNEENIGETAILNTNAAAVAFYGTTRTVYSSPNSLMNRYFTHHVLGSENNRRNTIGDAVRLAKVDLLTPDLSATRDTITDYTANKLNYILLGDPALKLGIPQYTLIVDTINGQALNDSLTTANFAAGNIASFSGHTVDTDGQNLTNFNGTLTTTIYDSQTLVTCLNNDGDSDPPVTYYARQNILYSGRDSITNGKFNITFPVPLDIKYTGETGRIQLYAITTDHLSQANGYTENFTVGGTGTDLTTDNQGPNITAYLNREDFVSGSTVNSTPYFVAFLQDESGINVTNNAVGHDLELSIDNNSQTTYNLNELYTSDYGDYTKGQVAYVIPELENGQHTLTFRAWDTMNNYSTITLDFNVDSSQSPDLISLTASNNPARTSTTFILRYDRPGTPCNFVIEVYDFAGRKLYTYSEQGTSETGIYYIDWNLTTSSGFPLATGVYLYRAIVSTEGSRCASDANKLIILRNK